MDPRRFDALVRSLETSGTRRAALGWAGGVLAALGVDGRGDATAGRRRHAHAPTSAPARHAPPCDPGFARCKTKKRRHPCVDLDTDPNNCGKCRHKCATGQGCRGGECACIPHPDETTCAGKCGTIANNCGQNVDCTQVCQGCCDGATCLDFDQQADQSCGNGGVDCTTCRAGYFCEFGNCVCIGAGGACDPEANPDRCCAFESAICGVGTAQPDRTCCLEIGAVCVPTQDRNCVPGSGCCCSGFCGADSHCAEPPTS